jgi:fumarylacetoacetase
MPDHTHDPALRSWVESANRADSEFPVQNLPWCRFRIPGEERTRAGVRIGESLLDATGAFGIESVQSVMAMPRAARVEWRHRISEALTVFSPGFDRFLVSVSAAELLLPCEIGDYTDFYASLHHATNVGALFRPSDPLQPNYKWMPIAYHGRSSSIVLSGTAIRRPRGQITKDRIGPPVFAPTGALDYEVEIGAFLGPGNRMGQPIPACDSGEHLAGVCLLNDWSARDIQSWEYQPLGPFLSKNFASTISPWVVTMEALDPFRVLPEPRASSDPAPLPYLQDASQDAYAITVEVWLSSARMDEPALVSRGNFASMYWTLGQMLAHHTANGCPVRPGDLIGSGTVSGPEAMNRGCLLEMTRRGSEPLALPNGETRAFLHDGDEVILRGWCETPGYRRIGLGECRGRILPAA